MAEKILVSGANGFIASHTIKKLLTLGHEIVGTVRNPEDPKNAHLSAMDGAPERLTLVASDLTDPDPFSNHTDVDVIMHMASPYVIAVDDPQKDLVDPAVQGTLSMLRAAAKSSRVRRVVLTSSVAAITDEPDGRVLTEEDWNTRSSLKRNPYYYSKTLAERAAWEFMAEEKPGFSLVVINPFLVIGPSMTASVNTSNQILADIITGGYPAVMALNWGIVDVRDVADSHIAAMQKDGASGRFFCASATISMAEVVALMRDCGYGNTKLPKFVLSGAVGTQIMKLASWTQPAAVGSYLRTHLGRTPRFDHGKAVRELGIEFRPPHDSIKDTLADLSRWGHIPNPQ